MAIKKVTQVGTPAKAEPTAFDVVEEDKPVSLLEQFRQQVTKSVDGEPYELIVPKRGDITMMFKVHDLDYDTYQLWMRRAEDKKTKLVNYFNLSATVISNLNVGIKLNGQEVDQDGEPMLITSPALHGFLGVPVGNTKAAIRKLYGSDGHAIQTTRMVIEAAGYTLDGDVVEADNGPLER